MPKGRGGLCRQLPWHTTLQAHSLGHRYGCLANENGSVRLCSLFAEPRKGAVRAVLRYQFPRKRMVARAKLLRSARCVQWRARRALGAEKACLTPCALLGLGNEGAVGVFVLRQGALVHGAKCLLARQRLALLKLQPVRKGRATA